MEKKKNRTGIFETTGFSTKEELLEAVKIKIAKIKKEYPKEEKNSEKYKAYELYLNEFLNLVKRIELPELKDENWSYSFGVSQYGANILMGQYDIKSEKEMRINCSYRLKSVKPRALPANEYASLHGVSDTTVRQWIRRGKLRNASKYGNTWRIPEFDEPSKGQYCNVIMWWEAILTDLTSEYEFLNKYDEVQIQQLSKDEYKVWFANRKTYEYEIRTMDRKERERFELMMIANPFVDLYDLPVIDVDRLEENWKKYHNGKKSGR